MNTRIALTVGIAGGVLALAGVGAVVAASNVAGDGGDAESVATSATTSPREEADEDTGAGDVTETGETGDATEPYDTTAALLFLIEEEKLAHDVYTTLSDRWGTQVFSNIAGSEVTHQELVAPLLEERDIEDPRSSEVGVFTDPALQALYDDLIASGSQSLEDAIQVGITIEETDIADLGEAIASEDEADVVSVLERLLAGSENHLRSFERLA